MVLRLFGGFVVFMFKCIIMKFRSFRFLTLTFRDLKFLILVEAHFRI